MADLQRDAYHARQVFPFSLYSHDFPWTKRRIRKILCNPDLYVIPLVEFHDSFRLLDLSEEDILRERSITVGITDADNSGEPSAPAEQAVSVPVPLHGFPSLTALSSPSIFTPSMWTDLQLCTEHYYVCMTRNIHVYSHINAFACYYDHTKITLVTRNVMYNRACLQFIAILTVPYLLYPIFYSLTIRVFRILSVMGSD